MQNHSKMKPLKKTEEVLVSKTEKTLGRIAVKINHKEKYDTFGLIIDASDPYKAEKTEFYTTKLKIIDYTFNINEAIENREIKIQNYAYVFIKNLNKEDAPQVKTVGSVIRLRRFNFKINEQGELYAIMLEFSNWLLIVKSPNNQPIIDDKMERNSNEHRQLSEFEKDQSKKIFTWGQNLLENNSLRSLLWWKSLIEPNNLLHAASRNLSQNGVDLILKVDKVEVDIRMIILLDEASKKYFLTMESKPTIKPGSFIKLRNVDVKFSHEGRIIYLRNSSSCLLIPEGCFDIKLFSPDFYQKNFNKILISKARNFGDEDNFERRNKILNIYPSLKDFYFEDFLLGNKKLLMRPITNKIKSSSATLIKKEYTNKAPTLLNDILNMNRSSMEKFLHQKFVILVSVVEIAHLSEIFFFNKCSNCKKLHNFSENKLSECCQSLFSQVISTYILVKDSSVIKPMRIYLVIRSKSKNPFLLWHVMENLEGSSEVQKIKNTDSQNLKHKLEALIKEKELMKLVVELKRTSKGIVFFEATDTYFLP